MSFGAYLVGTWESRFGVGTSLQIINPTVDLLDITVAFLDADERFIRCMKLELSPNKMEEIIVPELKLGPPYGVVKIISHKDGEIRRGIVGFQRHVLAIPRPTEVAFSEAPLAAIPMEYAKAEYKRFLEHHCP